MVRSGGESPTRGDANLLPASVPDIGRSLRLAREQADLSVAEAATRAGLGATMVESLEAGNVGPQHDRIATLRSLRTYAGSLGLPGDEYVLVAVEQWPANGSVLTLNGDTAVVPVVSISSAPAGGHTPAGGHGSVWPGDAAGISDTSATGIMGASHTSTITDTGRMRALDTGVVPAVDTGEVRAIRVGVPPALKFLVGLVTVLVVLAAVALVENHNVDGWYHDGRTATTRWVNDVKSALGAGPSSKSHHDAPTTTATSTPAAKKTTGPTVHTVTALDGLSATMTVNKPSFTVKIEAAGRPCWIEATALGQTAPLFAGDLQANQSHTFTITDSVTVQMGSAAGRAFVYEGTKLLSYYFPSKAPFSLTFAATGTH